MKFGFRSNFRSVFVFHWFSSFIIPTFGKIWLFTSFSEFRIPIFGKIWLFTQFFGFQLSIIISFWLKIVVKMLKSENCLWRFQNKNRKQISLFGQQFSVKILRNDRSEAFCGSSGKILHLTFRGFAFGRDFEAETFS